MNKDDRKTIDALKIVLERIKDEVEVIVGQVNDLVESERSKFENMSEGLQQSERGQAIEAALNALDDAESSAQEAVAALESAIESLEEWMNG